MGNKAYPVKVLQVTIGDGNFGGVANFLYTYYSFINKERIHFDFLYCGKNSLKNKMNSPVIRDSKIIELGILKANNNGFKEYIKLSKKMKELLLEDYDIIHINTSNVFVNFLVTYLGHKKAQCISHSHNTESKIKYSSKSKTLLKKLMYYPCRKYIIKKNKKLFACSMAAGKFLYGESGISNEKFRVIPNAIQLNRFKFDFLLRNEYRNSYKCSSSTKVYGFIGRLSDQKNPIFLLKVFREILNQQKDAVLWVIGDGELKEKVKETIQDLELQSNVLLFGLRSDVNKLVQAIDFLLFPSLYEGLSIVTIEAQAAGIQIYASDSISPEHKITNLVHFLSLNQSPEDWANYILNHQKFSIDRGKYYFMMKNKGYDIEQEATKLENIYLSMIS